MQYYTLTTKKHHFIVTPDELRGLLGKYHHVVMTTGVRKGYVESDPGDFFSKYDELYRKLKNGERLVWEKDYSIVSFGTGITKHLENCTYKPGGKLWVPDFSEPCVYVDTFCFAMRDGQLTTAFWEAQFPENVSGLCVSFPDKIEYEAANAKHSAGIVRSAELDDFETYEEILSTIRSVTAPLKFEIDGKIRRTAVRVSPEAKKDLGKFYFVAQNNIRLM